MVKLILFTRRHGTRQHHIVMLLTGVPNLRVEDLAKRVVDVPISQLTHSQEEYPGWWW